MDVAGDAETRLEAPAGEAMLAALIDRWYGPTQMLARALAPDDDLAHRAVGAAWRRAIDRIDDPGAAIAPHILVLRATLEEVAAEIEAGGPRPAVEPARFEPEDHRWGGWWKDEAQPDETWPRPPRGEWLTAAIGTLEPAPAAVVLLRDVEGLAPAEVEAALGLPVDLQRKLLHEGRSGIWRALTGDG